MSVQFPTNASVCMNGKILWELYLHVQNYVVTY